MAWQKPSDLFGTTPRDRMMMEEVLELLSTGSLTSDYELFSSDVSHNCSSIQNGQGMLDKCLVASPEAVMGSQSDALVQEVKCDGETYVGKPKQEPSPAPDQARATRHVIHGTDSLWCNGNLHLIEVAPVPVSSQNMPSAGLDPIGIRDSSTATTIPISPPASVLHQSLKDSPLPGQRSCIPDHQNLDKNIVSNGQRIFVMDATEFDELRRKMQMQTASRRYRKRKKERSRHETVQLQKLQVELSRLQDRETQMKKYQQRSIESLQQELEMHQDEVATFSSKLKDAASEEIDWVTTTHLTGASLQDKVIHGFCGMLGVST